VPGDERVKDAAAELSEKTRRGGGGAEVPADDPLDRSVRDTDATDAAEHATPPTEGPAAAGSLPG
jgi:hypothetical protein